MRRLLHAMTLLALGLGLLVSSLPPAAAHKGGSAAHQRAHRRAAQKRLATKRTAKKRTTRKRTAKKATHTMHGKTMPGTKHTPGMKH